jgi:hypothetical protein
MQVLRRERSEMKAAMDEQKRLRQELSEAGRCRLKPVFASMQ